MDMMASPRTRAQECINVRVHRVLERAAGHYARNLRNSPEGVAYLSKRGITGAAAARFGLGFARQAWQDLGEVFDGVDTQAIEASGLTATSGEGGRTFDRFRGRIMFPIRDQAGNVLGFGGRTIAGDDPKYLNSPEGPTFQKRRTLYGIYEAQDAIREDQSACVMEGFVDVVAVAQAGMRSVVGTLGTACTPEHIADLLMLTTRITFCFDGDDAGRRAAARAVEAALPFACAGRSLAFAFLPTGEDPDSFVRSQGLVAFRSVLAAATPLVDFVFELAEEGCDLRYAEGKARCAHRMRGFWHLTNDAELQAAMVEHCAELLDMPDADVVALWEREGV